MTRGHDVAHEPERASSRGLLQTSQELADLLHALGPAEEGAREALAPEGSRLAQLLAGWRLCLLSIVAIEINKKYIST